MLTAGGVRVSESGSWGDKTSMLREAGKGAQRVRDEKREATGSGGYRREFPDTEYTPVSLGDRDISTEISGFQCKMDSGVEVVRLDRCGLIGTV